MVVGVSARCGGPLPDGAAPPVSVGVSMSVTVSVAVGVSVGVSMSVSMSECEHE